MIRTLGWTSIAIFLVLGLIGLVRALKASPAALNPESQQTMERIGDFLERNPQMLSKLQVDEKSGLHRNASETRQTFTGISSYQLIYSQVRIFWNPVPKVSNYCLELKFADEHPKPICNLKTAYFNNQDGRSLIVYGFSREGSQLSFQMELGSLILSSLKNNPQSKPSFEVRILTANDGDGETPDENPASRWIKIHPSQVLQIKAGHFTAAKPRDSEVTLKWSVPNDPQPELIQYPDKKIPLPISFYRIYRFSVPGDSGSPGELIDRLVNSENPLPLAELVGKSDQPQWKDTNLKPGFTYYYTVVPVIYDENHDLAELSPQNFSTDIQTHTVRPVIAPSLQGVNNWMAQGFDVGAYVTWVHFQGS